MTYLLNGDRNVKMADSNFKEKMRRINFEVDLWQSNDVRTYAHTGYDMLTVDLCSQRKQINTTVYHVKVTDDRYFDNNIVEQHLNVIYSDVEILKTKLKGHAPTVIGEANEAAPFIPRKLRSILK